MKNINKFPHCFWFIDFITICSIRVFEDLVCLHGAYHDPITRKLVPAYFETNFDWFYNLLNVHDDIINAQKALDALTDSINGAPAGLDIDLDARELIEINGIVFRLSTMMEDYPQKAEKFTGFFIEDAYPMKHGFLSYNQYVTNPEMEEWDVRTKVSVMRNVKNVSGHLVVLALRYVYYRSCIKEGKCDDEALYISSLQDMALFEAAKAAYEYIDALVQECIV